MWENKKAVFIIGSPRSGTTWLLRLLRLHSQVAIASEPYLKLKGEKEESNFFNYHIKEVKFKNELQKRNFIHKRYFSPLSTSQVAFIDKTPKHSFYLTEITKYFPNCYFIHLIRNGLDVTASLKEFRYLQSKGYHPSGEISRPSNWREEEEFKSLVDVFSDVYTWRLHTEAAFEAKDLSNNYLEIRYEDLLLNVEETLLCLFNYLGINNEIKDIFSIYDPEAPSYLGTDPHIKIVGGINRWKLSLSQIQIEEFISYSGELMKKLGYSLD